MEFTMKEYQPSMEAVFEEQFLRYARDDLGDGLPEEILREKIGKGVFVKNWERGINRITLAFAGEEPAGFAIYQVDGPESDWCKRPGWGLIREFRVAPRFRRLGCGRTLAAWAEAELRKKADRLYLTAHDEAAVGFWTACGFRATGEINQNGTHTMEK